MGRGAGPFCLPAGRQIRPQPSSPAGLLKPVCVTLDSRRGDTPRSQGGNRVRLACPKCPRLRSRVPQHIRQQPALTQALNPSRLPKSSPNAIFQLSSRFIAVSASLSHASNVEPHLAIRHWLLAIFAGPSSLRRYDSSRSSHLAPANPSRGRGSLPAATHTVHFS